MGGGGGGEVWNVPAAIAFAEPMLLDKLVVALSLISESYDNETILLV